MTLWSLKQNVFAGSQTCLDGRSEENRILVLVHLRWKFRSWLVDLAARIPMDSHVPHKNSKPQCLGMGVVVEVVLCPDTALRKGSCWLERCPQMGRFWLRFATISTWDIHVISSKKKKEKKDKKKESKKLKKKDSHHWSWSFILKLKFEIQSNHLWSCKRRSTFWNLWLRFYYLWKKVYVLEFVIQMPIEMKKI